MSFVNFADGATALAIRVGGTEIVTAARVLQNVARIEVAAGSVSAPALAPTGDPNTGLYFPAADEAALATGGVQRLRTLAGVVIVGAGSTAGLAAAGGIKVGAASEFDADLRSAGAFGLATSQTHAPSAAVHDFALGATTTRLRSSAQAASVDITGIAGGWAGRVLAYMNSGGANDMVIKHENTGSSAANRFLTPAGGDVTVTWNAGVILIYDGANERWRVMTL